jgi:hypothetical protein
MTRICRRVVDERGVRLSPRCWGGGREPGRKSLKNRRATEARGRDDGDDAPPFDGACLSVRPSRTSLSRRPSSAALETATRPRTRSARQSARRVWGTAGRAGYVGYHRLALAANTAGPSPLHGPRASSTTISLSSSSRGENALSRISLGGRSPRDTPGEARRARCGRRGAGARAPKRDVARYASRSLLVRGVRGESTVDSVLYHLSLSRYTIISLFCASPSQSPLLLRAFVRHGRRAGPPRNVNDPSAGSPTETLLRLLLPLNDQVWSSSRQHRQCRRIAAHQSEDLTKSFNR